MMLELIFTGIIYIFEMLIAYSFFTKLYEIRLKNSFYVILIGLLLFLPSAYLFATDSEYLNLAIFFAINAIFSFSCFKIPVFESVMFSIVLDAIMFATEMIVVYSAASIFSSSTGGYKNNQLEYIILGSISKLLYLVASQIFLSVVKKIKNNTNGSKQATQYLPLFLFPILIIAFSAMLLRIEIDGRLTQTAQLVLAVINILSVFICIFVYIYYQLLSENEAKAAALEKEKQFYETNSNYLEILKHQNDELQMLFHDTKHHFLAINSLNSKEEISEYSSKVLKELEDKNTITITNNRLLNVIINKYIILCKNEKIKFSYEVKTANLDYIDNFELTVILNNILDNAVEAARKSTERTIYFSIRKINNMDMVSLINSCDVEPNHNGKNLITSKENSERHGYGMKSVIKNVEACGGNLEWYYDNKNHEFHLTIMFNDIARIHQN